MGTLAAWYLRNADQAVTVLRRQGPARLDKTLCFADGRPAQALTLPVIAPAALRAPIRRLIVACKTPYTDDALAGLPGAMRSVSANGTS